MTAQKLHKLPKNTFQIDVTIPWSTIEQEYSKAFDRLHKEFELKGYRKGKVPKELAEKNLPKDIVYQQTIRDYMPTLYREVLDKEQLKPIISPKIDLKKAKENEDWEVSFTLAEKPSVDLKNYKEVAKKAKDKAKKVEILIPGKKEEPQENQQQNQLNSILDALMKEVKIEISDLIMEEELQNRLTKLVDDIQRLGLTTETYLKSKNITMDDLKKQFSQEIEEMYKVEFLLGAIAEEEKITVEQTDLEKLFASIKDENDKQAAMQNAYFYASILRKQKVLEFLSSL